MVMISAQVVQQKHYVPGLRSLSFVNVDIVEYLRRVNERRMQLDGAGRQAFRASMRRTIQHDSAGSEDVRHKVSTVQWIIPAWTIVHSMAVLGRIRLGFAVRERQGTA